MNVYSDKTAEAARWIFDHKEQSVDWVWRVLTANNPASDTLRFPPVVAYQIFTILEHEGLIEPFEFTDRDGKQTVAHRLVLADKAKWDAVRHPPSFLRRFVWPPIKGIFTNLWAFLFWVVSVTIPILIKKWLE
jgi:hypothetical protein